ncbi:hypothetical protein [Phenylobacterium sp.]|uniref:hypothetical protein n=1 Tax=Phenylobacterium sp. TaxID=1871053 RepID=UPI0019B399A6|nr:hypothetical protein [Phenylobacterium sp.]MBC7168971.1 hypothetical protein [Phenylobacterium sp.]
MKSIGGALVLMTAAASPALSQEAEIPLGDERPPEVTILDPMAKDEGRFGVDVGAVAVSQYISRGVAFTEEPSLQPYGNIRIDLPELTGGAVTGANLTFGTWGSAQDGPPGLDQANDGDFPGWYEADLYAGAAVQLADRWNGALTYYHYHSPADSFADYGDLELIVGYDDAGRWERVPLRGFSLNPALRLAHEMSRPNRKDALYIQPSLTPSFGLGAPERNLTVSIPLVAGFSDHYYDAIGGGNADYGFFRTGVAVSMTPFPQALESLSLSGGVDLWFPNDDVANGLDDQELVTRFGVNWSF